MIWHEINAVYALDRQRALLHEAEAQRLAREVRDPTPRYREWLARRLVMLALRLAPSLGPSLRGMDLEEDGEAPSPHRPANGRPLAPLFDGIIPHNI